MTEQEYINLLALKDIRIAKNHISEVITPMVSLYIRPREANSYSNIK